MKPHIINYETLKTHIWANQVLASDPESKRRITGHANGEEVWFIVSINEEVAITSSLEHAAKIFNGECHLGDYEESSKKRQDGLHIKALYHLLSLYQAKLRTVWEEGKSERAVWDGVMDFLANQKLHPFRKEEIKKFMQEAEELFDRRMT